MEDFNAHIKVNGEGGQWPDNGLVQYNTLTNSHPRTTVKTVALDALQLQLTGDGQHPRHVGHVGVKDVCTVTRGGFRNFSRKLF